MPDLNDNIQLPSGFKLDTKVDSKSSEISLPKGFTLDTDVKKKAGGVVSSPIPSKLPSQESNLPDFQKGLDIAQKGYAMTSAGGTEKQPEQGNLDLPTFGQNLREKTVEKAADIVIPTIKFLRNLSGKLPGANKPEDIYNEQGELTDYGKSIQGSDFLGQAIKSFSETRQKERELQQTVGKLPETSAGQIAQGITSIAPDIALAFMTGGKNLFGGTSKLAAAGNALTGAFVREQAISGAAKGYDISDGKSVGETLGNIVKESGKDAGTAMLYEGAGFLGGKIGNILSSPLKNTTAKGAVNLLARLATFSLGTSNAQSLIDKGELASEDEVLKNLGIAGVMETFHGAGKAAGKIAEKVSQDKYIADLKKVNDIRAGAAIQNFMKASPDVIDNLVKSEQTAQHLNLAAMDAVKRSENLPDGEEKSQLLKTASNLTQAADIKHVTDVIANSTDGLAHIANDLPEDVRDAFMQKAQDIHQTLNPTELQKQGHAANISQAEEIAKQFEPLAKPENPNVLERIQAERKLNEAKSVIDENTKNLNKVLDEQEKINKQLQEAKLKEEGSKKYVVDGKKVSQEEFEAMQGKPTGTKEIITQEVKPIEAKSELIGTENAFPISELNKIPKGELHRSKESQNKLIEDISKNGIKEPLTLVYYVKDNALRLREGHHRLDAANKLRLKDVPVKVQVEWDKSIKDDKDIKGQELYHPPVPLDIENYKKRNYQPSNINLSELGFKEKLTKPTEEQLKTKENAIQEPSTKEIIQPTELEAKKADIEERRQEELRTSLDLLPLVSKEERSLELQKRYDERESKEKEINAKYDAEIAALKEVKPTEVKVTEEIKPVETKVAKPIEGIDTIKLTDLPDRAFSVGMTKEKFEDLKSKIQKEGFTQPIIIDKETNNVLDGQNRLLVAQDLDIKDVPVVYMNNPTKTELKEKIKELEKQYIPIKEVKAIGLKEEPIIEEPLKEEPLKEEPIESEEERKGISKEAIYNRYGFAKKFKTVHDKDLVIDVMDKLETSANKKGISTEQEAENIVEKIKNKKIRGTASQFEILASAYHLENLDKQIEKLNDLGEDPTPLLEKRQKALEVLRELGKNSGSNLRLFSNAYKVAEDGKLQIFRARLKNSLGVDIIPTTKSELAQSNLSAEDKAKVAPYVQEIENVKNELNKIKKESEAKIQKENTKEIKNYVDKEITKTETSAKLTIEEAKKAAKKLRNIADNVENFLKAKGAEGAETAGIDIQKKIAQAIRYVADKIEKGEVPDLIVRAINKFASEDLSEKELRTHITDALTEAGIDKKLIEGETTKDKAINKIIKIAKEEKSNIITKSMSDKGLINDVVNHYIHLNTPYDEVIKEATSELKKHLPDVEETDVENAILKKGEFKQQTKQELKSEIKQKQEDVKRLANTNLKVKALQVISNIKEVENDATLSTEQKKIEIEKRKSDYEKSLDKKISDNEQEIKNQIEKDKQSKLEYKKLETERNRQLKVVTELTKKLNDLQAGIKEPKVKGEPKKDIPEIEALKVKIKEADSELKKTESAQKKAKTEAENLKNKIKDIEDEIKHVQDERTVYNKEIKNPNEVNQKLKEFKDILQQEYAKIGIRKESGSKTEIKIAQDSQNAIDEIKNSDLPDDVKKEHIKDIENQRDEQLRNTKQGVLVNLKDAIDLHLEDLKSKLDEAEKNDDKETFKKTNEVLKDLQRLSDALKPNAENLKDQIDKADQDLNAILKYNKGNEFESDLKKIQDEYRESWQKTSDELQAAELLRKSQRSQAEAERKLAGGQYTEIPTTQYDVSRNKILAEQQAEEEKAWSKLNSMAMEARKQQKEKSVIAKILEARKQILVASFTAIEKVLGSAITKPIIDPIIKQSFGRLSSLITKIRPTELRNIGETYRQLKNEESARQFMSKVNDDYIDAIVKYQKDKGTPNEKEALIKLKEAEIDNNAALAYLFINANSAIDIMQIMKNGATEFDSKMGKYKQSFPEQRTKIENIRFWLEGVNRSHAAMKSISHRQALLDHYIENLQYFQDKKGYITDESRHQAWDAATLSSEEGRFGENTYLSDLISKGKNSKSEALKNLTNFSLPVAKIGINITKQGLDMAFPGELGYKVYDLAGKGTKMNEAQGKEYSNAFSKWKDGIKTAFESLPLKEKKQINTLLFRGMFGVAQYALIGYLLSNKSIKYGGSYDENDPFRKKAPRGSDGRPLKAGEWEINGKRQPTIINMIINHSPYALPASLAAVSYNQMTSRKESERHYYKIFGKVVNEVYERLPIAGALDIGKALMGADEYKFNRLVANEVPSMKNVAEFTDKDAQGNPIKRKTKTIGEMIKANYPVLRQTLPRKY